MFFNIFYFQDSVTEKDKDKFHEKKKQNSLSLGRRGEEGCGCLGWEGRDTSAEDFNPISATIFRRKSYRIRLFFLSESFFSYFSFACIVTKIVEKKELFCFFSRYFYYFPPKEDSYNLKICIPASVANCSTIGSLL
jgi:hypothetical protein